MPCTPHSVPGKSPMVSIRRRPRVLDSFCPLDRFGFDERRKLRAAAGCEIDAKVGEAGLQVRLVQCLVDFAVELGDDSLRRRRRCADSVPRIDFEARESRFDECRHFRQLRTALSRGDAQRTHLSGPHRCHRDWNVFEYREHVPAHQVGHRQRAALVRHVHQLIPVTLMSISIARCSVLPIPEEPKLYLPGLAFAYATNSPADATGVDGCTTSTL